MPNLFELTDHYIEAIFHHEQSAVYYISEDEADRTRTDSNFSKASAEMEGKIFFITTGIKGEVG